MRSEHVDARATIANSTFDSRRLEAAAAAITLSNGQKAAYFLLNTRLLSDSNVPQRNERRLCGLALESYGAQRSLVAGRQRLFFDHRSHRYARLAI